jgi:hypothetical protein
MSQTSALAASSPRLKNQCTVSASSMNVSPALCTVSPLSRPSVQAPLSMWTTPGVSAALW